MFFPPQCSFLLIFKAVRKESEENGIIKVKWRVSRGMCPALDVAGRLSKVRLQKGSLGLAGALKGQF